VLTKHDTREKSRSPSLQKNTTPTPLPSPPSHSSTRRTTLTRTRSCAPTHRRPRASGGQLVQHDSSHHRVSSHSETRRHRATSFGKARRWPPTPSRRAHVSTPAPSSPTQPLLATNQRSSHWTTTECRLLNSSCSLARNRVPTSMRLNPPSRPTSNPCPPAHNTRRHPAPAQAR
jgi:hypothetical protein